MTKKEAAVVIGFIQMLPIDNEKGWSSDFRKVDEKQFGYYVALVNSMVEDVQEDPNQG
jgi:hypothetical protein